MRRAAYGSRVSGLLDTARNGNGKAGNVELDQLAQNVVLMLRDEQRYKYVDVEKAGHGCLLCPVAMRETIDILDRDHWCARSRPKYGNTAVEADVRLSHPAKQRFYEVVDWLPRLTGEIGKPGFQVCVKGNRGSWHRPTFRLIVHGRTKATREASRSA
jgi:hypothetical protein